MQLAEETYMSYDCLHRENSCIVHYSPLIMLYVIAQDIDIEKITYTLYLVYSPRRISRKKSQLKSTTHSV